MSESTENIERPQWLPEKFKTPEDLSKSYGELEKKLGGFVGAPEEYAIPEGVDPELRLAKLLKENGKRLNMSQEAFNDIVSNYHSTKHLEREAFKSHLEKLEPEARKTVNEVITFIKNNFSEEEAKKISSMMRSMDDISLFDKMRKIKSASSTGGKVLMPEESQSTTLEDYKSTIDFKKMETDRGYRNKVTSDLKRLTS